MLYSWAVATSADGVLAEARAAPADSGLQETRSDAGVQADPLGHLRNIGAHLFGQLPDFVDVGNLGRQKRIGGILDQLGRSRDRWKSSGTAPTPSGRGR